MGMPEVDQFLFVLNEKEREVVVQASYGGTRQEVADALNLSLGLVNKLLGRALQLLEVKSSNELIAMYWQCRVRDLEGKIKALLIQQVQLECQP